MAPLQTDAPPCCGAVSRERPRAVISGHVRPAAPKLWTARQVTASVDGERPPVRSLWLRNEPPRDLRRSPVIARSLYLFCPPPGLFLRQTRPKLWAVIARAKGITDGSMIGVATVGHHLADQVSGLVLRLTRCFRDLRTCVTSMAHARSSVIPRGITVRRRTAANSRGSPSSAALSCAFVYRRT